jgi:hypothetical protein
MALTKAEDDDLRRLTAFDRIGFLNDAAARRLADLRARDRREGVRPFADRLELVSPLRRLSGGDQASLCSVYPTGRFPRAI